MTREQKIEFLIKRLGDRLTKAYLETKSDDFINHLYTVESNFDDMQVMDSIACA